MDIWEKWQRVRTDQKSYEYRKAHIPEDAEQAKTVIKIITLLVIAFAYVDYLFFGLGKMFYWSLTARCIFTGISLLVIGQLKKRNGVKTNDYAILAWTCALGLLALGINATRPSEFNDNILLHGVMILGSYTVLPNRLLFKTLPAVVFSLTDMFILIFLKTEIGPPGLIISAVAFLALNAIGYLSANRHENYRRRQHDIQVLEQRNRLQLIELATTDSLTHIYNRRRFIELAEIEFERYKRFKRVFSFIVMDIDKFKLINDTYGHPAGDLVLQRFCELLVSNKRSIDATGRLGGDEIGMFLPGTNTRDATKLIKRIQKACEQIDLAELNFRISFSAGITEARPQDHSVDDLYRRADKSLYASKHKRRPHAGK